MMDEQWDTVQDDGGKEPFTRPQGQPEPVQARTRREQPSVEYHIGNFVYVM